MNAYKILNKAISFS